MINQLALRSSDPVNTAKRSRMVPNTRSSRAFCPGEICISVLLAKVKSYLKKIKTESDKVNKIQQNIFDIKSKNQSEFISNYSKLDNEELIKELKQQATDVKTSNICNSADSIKKYSRRNHNE